MTDSIQFKLATPDDLRLLRQLCIDTFEETFAPHNTREDMEAYLQQAFSEHQIVKELNESDTQYWIVYFNNEAAAYSRWCFGKQEPGMDAVNPMEFHRLYVLAKFKGKGIGHVILESAIEAAQKRNCDRIWLGVWENNVPAIAFYRKHGFERFGEHEFMLGKDLQIDWVMKKELV